MAALALLAAADAAALPADRAVSQYVRRAWTVESGLPHGTVRGLAQTRDGYLWIATYEGLVRFNGETFRVFDRTTAPGLLNASIDTMTRTNDDALWLGTFDGLVRYRNGRFETIRTETDLGIIKAIVPAGNDSVWVGTTKGRVIHVSGGTPRPITLPLPISPISALAMTGDALWIGTSRGLFRYEKGKLDAWTTKDGLSSDTIVTLAADGDAVLAGTAAGLDRVSARGVERIGGLPADQVTALRRDRDRNLWVGTYGHGVYRVAGDQVSPYGIGEGVLNPTIRAIFEDDEGNVWIGSQNGLEQLRGGAFVTWNRRQGLTDDNVRAVFEDRDGVMWFGTATSLYRWQNDGWSVVDDQRLTRILSLEQGRDGTRWFGTVTGLYRVSGGTTTLVLADNTIRDIHEDRAGNVWVATTDSGLSRIRPNGTIESFAGRGGLGAEYAMAITETPDGRIWVATGGGLGEFDGRAFRLHSAPRELPSNRLFAIASDDDGTVWIATEGDGVVRWRNGRAHAITSREGLPADKILSLVVDGSGNLWLGSVRGAFYVSRRELNDVADGKRDRVHYSFFDENDGLGSRQCNGAANPAALRSSDGRIWLATTRGISATTRVRLPPPPVRSPIIERISINGRDRTMESLRSVLRADRIEFEFTGASFVSPERLHFRYRLEGYDEEWIDAGTSRRAAYTNLPAGNYRFEVASSRDGVRWQSANIGFKLRPRFYETNWFVALCVAAVIALFFFVHSVRLHLARERARLLEKLVEDRTRQINEEKERTELALREAEAAKREAERHEQMVERALAQAEEANRAKSIFLAATSHELRTPLNAIIGFSEILISRVSRQLDPRYARFLHNINASGQYLLGIINNILDISKIEAGRMEIVPETIPLREMVDGICAVMKGVTSLRQIHVEVEVPEDLPLIEADSTLLKQILYNLMSNAVKFSPERSAITVAARYLDADQSPLGESSIEVQVRDRGIGIDPADQQIIFEEFRQAAGGRREGTGLGLALVKRFVELHRGTIRVESEPGKGSTFVLTLPRVQPRVAAEERMRA